ncbi:MAG: GAF domain-containing protein [Thermoleophilia bacterium]
MSRVKEFLSVYRSRLGLKIAVPALAVVLVFSLPLALFYRYVIISNSTQADLANRNLALADLAKMEDGLQQELLAMHELFLDHYRGVTDHQASLAAFTAAAAAGDDSHHQAEKMAATGEERNWLSQCATLHQQTQATFLNVVVPQAGKPGSNLGAQEEQLRRQYDQMLALRSKISSAYTKDLNNTAAVQSRSENAASRMGWIGSIAAVLIGLVAAGISGRRLLVPIKRMSTAAREMSRGNLGCQVPVASGNDELAQLGNSFNFMADSLLRRTTQLEEEKARIRSIHQSIGDGILVADRDGVIISVNPAAEKALGKTALELERTTEVGVPQLEKALLHSIKPAEMIRCREVRNCEKQDCPCYNSKDKRCWLMCATHCSNGIQGTFRQKRDACERCEVFHRNAVQELEIEVGGRCYSVEVVPILDDEGQEGGRTVVMHDITELQQINRDLERHSRELASLNSMNEAMSESLDPATMMRSALEKVLEMRQADAATIHLLEDVSGDLVLAAAKGMDESLLAKVERLSTGQGCPQHILEIESSLIDNDLRDSKSVTPEIVEAGLLSYVGAPLKSKNRNLGVISLVASRRGEFSEDDMRLMTLAGMQVGAALDNAILYQESLQHTDKALARSRLLAALGSSLELDEVFDEFISETRKLVGFDRLSIAIDVGGGMLRRLAQNGKGPQEWKEELTFPAAGSLPGMVIRSGEPYFSGDITAGSVSLGQEQLAAEGLRSQLLMPLVAKGQVIGSLNLSSMKKDAYREADLEELKPVASYVALAIANQQLFEDVSRAKTEWEATFDSVTEGIVIVGKNHNIKRLNAAAAAMFGATINDLLGRSCHEVIHNSSHEPGDCPMSRASLEDGPVQAEQETPDGRVLELTVDTMFDAEGRSVGAVHFLRDITEAKRMRQQLLQSEKMVAVGRLVSGVAHEINNPLTGVIGYSQLLLSQDIDENVKRDAEAIRREAERATRIVRHLLSFARKHKAERSPVDVNAVVKDSLELKGYDLRVNNIQVETSLGEDLPQTMADPHQLQQVFLNLITNAEQAMLETSGSGSLKVSTGKTQGNIRVVFADDGPGIPEELHDRIFEPFFTTKDVGKGTGLGLSVCYGVVEEHDGRIWVESGAGPGAAIVVELPVVTAAVTGAPEREPQQPEHLTGKVLLVDDENSIREVLAETLRRNGHEVETAKDGKAALTMLKQRAFDCIVSDVKMPGMDGPSLFKAVREMDPAMTDRFIFISGDSINPSTQGYLTDLGKPYLSKPFNLEEFEAVLQTVLRTERPRAA